MKSYYCPFRGERTPLKPCVSAWWAQKSGHSRGVQPSAVPNQNRGNSLFKSLKRSAKGANVPHAKATAGLATVKMPTPEHVIIPMSMHIGAPAEPVVKKGDTVMVGTLIGKAGGFVSASIYSSVSGTVQDVAPMRMVNGSMTTAVAIKTDGEQTIDPACVPPTVTDKPSLMAAVQNCGLVGVGGAGFPAHVKLAANTIDTLLEMGVIPVVNENDTVSVNELKFSDNDNLASLLINPVEADLFVNLTTIGGVLDANPLETPDATIMPCIEDVRALNLDTLCGGKTSVGTGGMYSKLLSAHRVAQLGVPTAILPGCEPDVIPRLFAGETIGTWVRPEQRTVSRRKYWLAYQADPQGTLYLDTGAADAVRNHGKSLLPGGITEVHGSFEAGALVRLVYDRETVGVGLSNYNAADLLRIRGLKRHEVAAILGDAHYPEVVHRDNLLLDAAL